MAGEGEAEGWRRWRNGWLAVRQPFVSNTAMRNASWIQVANVDRTMIIRAEAGRWSSAARYLSCLVCLSLLLAVFVKAMHYSAVPHE